MANAQGRIDEASIAGRPAHPTTGSWKVNYGTSRAVRLFVLTGVEVIVGRIRDFDFFPKVLGIAAG